MNKKAFTLVELLAVIVILAVILAISVPSITDIIESSTREAFEIDAKMVLKAVDYKKLEDPNFDETLINKNNINDFLGLSADNYSSVSIFLEENVPIITIVGIGKWDGLVACGTYANMAIVKSTSDCSTDLVSPVITILGSNPTNIYFNETYSDDGATAIDDKDGDITDRIVVIGTVNPSTPGVYNITYSVADTIGNVTTATRIVNVIDNIGPSVSFDPDSNISYVKSINTTINIVDNSTINADSLKYVWSTSDIEPSIDEFTLSFVNNQSISTPEGLSGSYYLWAMATDIVGNQTIKKSEVFNLDNEKPIITINGDVDITISIGDMYSDDGAMVTDNIDTSLSVISSGTVNPNILGSYIITYDAIDSSGNAADTAIRTVNVVDVASPVITILGANPATVEAGTSYSDAGATALDNVDGDLTSIIVTTGTVNPSVVGTYQVTYTVSDTLGNESLATRTINVVDTNAPTISEALAGTMIYNDPTFASGINNMAIYNNLNNGSVTHTRVAMSTPTGSGYAMKIVTNGSANPGLGGYVQITTSKANGVYMHKIIARIPVGYAIELAANAIGTGGTQYWITSQAGTGDWKEYIYITRAGSTGSFASFGHVYISGPTATMANPMTWYVAYATIHDTTIWGTSNNVIIGSTDSGSGITAYGMNQSSITPPTFTAVASTKILGTSINNITATGTYYVWVKDASGNISKKALTVSYVDNTPPTISEALAGTMIFNDPTFASGINNMSIYNNSGNGMVTITREAMSTPTGSGYAMKIVTSGSASPGLGGFVQFVNSKANGVYMHRVIAKIPVGYTIERASNSVGTGATHTWITSQAGTGNWQEYIYITRAGSTGTFGSFGHLYIIGPAATSTNPITWYVAYSTIHDTTIWGASNNVIIGSTDLGSGITAYGMNQSSTVPPTFTAISSTEMLGTAINNITINGTYYVWVKDGIGNISNKSLIVSYIN